MKETKINNMKVVEYNSINEFVNYLKVTPVNKTFRKKSEDKNKLGSHTDGIYFTGTNSFEEAEKMLVNGWSEMSKEMTKDFKVAINDSQTKEMMKTIKTIFDVQGFQVSVPRFVNGIPDCMVSQRQVMKKDKVLSLVKNVGYLSDVSTETIKRESIKALKIVNILETQGYRVNLSIASPVEDRHGKDFCVIVKIKNSTERLNISKIAFPMANPSMLRRMIFCWRELYPEIPSTMYGGYGATIQNNKKMKEIMKDLGKTVYWIPNFINSFTEIKTTKDLSEL